MILNPYAPQRRGIALAMALGVLAVMMVVVVAVVGISRQARRGGSADERRLHAVWLLHAGANRAAARLLVDSSYGGETWTISPGRLGVPDPAKVTVTITANPVQAASRIAHIDARLAPGTRNQARASQTYTIDARLPRRSNFEGDSD